MLTNKYDRSIVSVHVGFVHSLWCKGNANRTDYKIYFAFSELLRTLYVLLKNIIGYKAYGCYSTQCEEA